MKNLKISFRAFACILVVTILTGTTFPKTTLAQTQTNFANQVSRASVPTDLKSTLHNFQQQRSNSLLNNTLTETNNYNFAKQSQKNNDPGMSQKSWMRKNWWIIPVLAGVGVGIYFLAKNSSSSGIRCNDGTISNAQNTQGACSYHGGIAR